MIGRWHKAIDLAVSQSGEQEQDVVSVNEMKCLSSEIYYRLLLFGIYP